MNRINSANNLGGRTIYGLLILLLTFVLAGCTPTDTKQAGGGSSGTGISQGSISGFGSLYSNGIKFDTTGTKITIDGAPVAENDLRVGMVATVIGDIDVGSSTAKALSVEASFHVAGPVESISLAQKNLIVLGQLVIFNSLTVFQNGGPEALKAGDYIVVSGFVNPSDATVAGYIKVTAPPTSNAGLITGTLSDLDRQARRFRIGAQTVNFASTEFIDMVESDLTNGMSVRVVGDRDLKGILLAKTVRNPAAKPIGKQDDLIVLEGIANVNFFTEAITVGGHAVLIGPETKYVNGTRKDIYTNSKLQVRGRVTTPGTIKAELIEFPFSPNISIIGNVESLGPSSNRVVVSGVSVVVTNFTRMLDVSAAQIQKFSLADIQVGDRLTIHGYQSQNGIDAFLLRRDALAGTGSGGDKLLTIRGLTGNTVANPYFDIGLTTVDTTGMSDSGSFLDRSGNSMSRSLFFNAIAGGVLVEAQGTYVTPVLTASLAKLLGQGNMTITGLNGEAITGVNDLVVSWNGSLNTEENVANGTTVVNMSINSRTRILGYEWTVRNIRVFGPGTYQFDTCQYRPGRSDCGVLRMTVRPNQIGAHMLLNWNTEYNVSAVNVWNTNQRYCADTPGPSCTIFAVSPDGISIAGLNQMHWDLASTDNDGDGSPGVTLIDGSFRGAIAVNFNLVY